VKTRSRRDSLTGPRTREKLRRVKLFPCVDTCAQLVRYRDVQASRRHTQLLPDTLELIQISLVLLLVLDLLPDTLEDPNGRGVVVDTTSSAEGSLDDGRRRDQIVGEAVVETTLDFEQILSLLEELDVALGEGFESLLVGGGGGRASEGWGDPTDGRPGAEESSERGGRTHIWWFEGEKKVEVAPRVATAGVGTEWIGCLLSLIFHLVFRDKIHDLDKNIYSPFSVDFSATFPVQKGAGNGRRTDSNYNHPRLVAFPKRSWPSTTYKPSSTFGSQQWKTVRLQSAHPRPHLHRQRVPP